MSTESHALLHHHFDDLEQQRETTSLGMWCFLSTEVMMFGGLMFAYTLYRWMYHAGYAYGSGHQNEVLGFINTCVLLCSSLTMAMAVNSAHNRNKKALLGFLVATIILGSIFIGIKGVEWHADYVEGFVPGMKFDHDFSAADLAENPTLPTQTMMYFILYFCMTGLHALHMVIGLGILLVLLSMSARGRFTNGNDQPVEMFGLYWHFVDIVWVFLFPLLYLIGGHPHGPG